MRLAITVWISIRGGLRHVVPSFLRLPLGCVGNGGSRDCAFAAPPGRVIVIAGAHNYEGAPAKLPFFIQRHLFREQVEYTVSLVRFVV